MAGNGFVMEEAASCSVSSGLNSPPARFTLGLIAIRTNNENLVDVLDAVSGSPLSPYFTPRSTLSLRNPTHSSPSSSPSVTSPAIGYVYYTGTEPLVPYDAPLVPYTPSSSSDDEPEHNPFWSFGVMYFINELVSVKEELNIPIDPDNEESWEYFIANSVPRLYEEDPEFDPETLKLTFKKMRQWFWGAQAKKPRNQFTPVDTEMFVLCQQLWG